jgi:hypothetical protein
VAMVADGGWERALAPSSLRSSLANKEAARSRSGGAVSHVLLSLNLGREKGNGGSYASTSVPHPWQDPASAGPAPSIPTLQ